MENKFSMAWQGWQCPICKRIYSPFTSMCPYCGGNQSSNLDVQPNTGSYDYNK